MHTLYRHCTESENKKERERERKKERKRLREKGKQCLFLVAPVALPNPYINIYKSIQVCASVYQG